MVGVVAGSENNSLSYFSHELTNVQQLHTIQLTYLMTLGLHPEIFNAKDATLRQEKKRYSMQWKG